MHFINILLAFLLPLLAVAQDTTIATSTRTQTLTRTIRVSQIATLTFTSFSSSTSSSAPISLNATSTYFPPTTSAKVTLIASAPAAVGSGAATTSQPIKTNFMGAAPALSASNIGMAGFVMVAVAALL
jgi:hypothetical protein